MGRKISRRSFGLLMAGTASAGPRSMRALFASPVPAAADEEGKTVFPYGTHVYREPSLPLEQLRADFLILKRLGFTMVKLQEVWANDEKREGESDLSKASQIVSDARQNGLRVYFGVTMENAPAWLWKKYPDAHMVYETGQPHLDPTQYVLPADGKPGPCWHHPGAREAGIHFIETVGREIGKYDNILVWNVWQEIGFWPMRPGHLGFCFCHYTLAQFRSWLRERYKTLDTLNETWKTAYGDWEEVEPPRFSPQVPPTIDWRYFMDDVYLTDALKWKAEAFRNSDPLHRPILGHVSAPDIGSTREWRYAEALDILGSSCYPAWQAFSKWDQEAPSAGKPIGKLDGLYHELWESVMMRFDYLRSAGRNGEVWTAELQGGPIVRGLDRARVPETPDIRRWVLGCLAAGVRGICFWNHRPEIFWQEGYGFSLLDWDSDRSARADEAGRLAQAINTHADLFVKGEHPQPAVALVMNEDLFHFAEGSISNVLQHYVHTIRGNYKSLWEEGIPVGFVEAERIPSESDQLKALILPFPVALGRSVIEALQAFVRNGGTLISEACPGRFTEYGFGYKENVAPGVMELFGARHKQVVVMREPGPGAKWTSPEYSYGDTVQYQDLSGAGDFSSLHVSPAYYVETITPSTATPILMCGKEVAGCVNRYGKGRAYLIGTLLGHALLSYKDRRNATFLAAILTRAGIKPDRVGRLQRRQRVLGNKTAWFLFNTTSEAVEETVSLPGFKSAKDLLGEELRVERGKTTVRVDPLDIRCLILET